MPDSSSRHSGCAFLNQLIIKKMPYSHAHCQYNGGNSLDEGPSSRMTLFLCQIERPSCSRLYVKQRNRKHIPYQEKLKHLLRKSPLWWRASI